MAVVHRSPMNPPKRSDEPELAQKQCRLSLRESTLFRGVKGDKTAESFWDKYYELALDILMAVRCLFSSQLAGAFVIDGSVPSDRCDLPSRQAFTGRNLFDRPISPANGCFAGSCDRRLAALML